MRKKNLVNYLEEIQNKKFFLVFMFIMYFYFFFIHCSIYVSRYHLLIIQMGDTRQLRVGSHDAAFGTLLPGGSGFEIDLGNVIQQIGQDVVGYSTESVGFYNVQPVVETGVSDRLVFLAGGFNGDEPFEVIIPQTVAGDVEEKSTMSELLASRLETAIATASSGLWTPTVVASPQGTFIIDSAQSSEFYIYAEGFPRNVDGISPSNAAVRAYGIVTPLERIGTGIAPLETSLWDLGGDRVAFLHSSLLAHDKTSIDGEGLQMSSFCSIPITAGYGDFNHGYPNQYETMTVFWGRKHMIRNVNFRLRTVRGDLYNLQNTEMYFVLRLFLAGK